MIKNFEKYLFKFSFGHIIYRIRDNVMINYKH